MLEKTLESPLDCKEIQPVHPKGNHSWIFIGRTDAEAETPILWPPDAKNWLIWKDPDAGKNRKQEEKGTAEDGMVGWHHRLSGHEFEQALGVGGGQGGLACCRLCCHWVGYNWTTDLKSRGGKLDAIFFGICMKGLWQGDLPDGLLVNNLPTNAGAMCSIPSPYRFHMLQGS